jgi:hypothetical protein
MPAVPGPKPRGDRALTGAERSKGYRERKALAGTKPVIRYRRPKDRRSRPERWREAVAQLMLLQAEYQIWLDSLPASLADTVLADTLRMVCDLDLSELEIELPRGFGRD